MKKRTLKLISSCCLLVLFLGVGVSHPGFAGKDGKDHFLAEETGNLESATEAPADLSFGGFFAWLIQFLPSTGGDATSTTEDDGGGPGAPVRECPPDCGTP